MEEEQKARRERRQQQDKKYGIQAYVEGYPMLLTEDFVSSVWTSAQPREAAFEYLYNQLERLKVVNKVKDDELRMYANQILFDLIHLKKDLEFTESKCYLALNLLFYNFINNDSRFNIEYPYVKVQTSEEEEEEAEEQPAKLEDEIDRSEIQVLDALDGKTYESDLKDFKEYLSKMAKKNPSIFTKQDLVALVNHALTSFFNNYNLFRYNSLYEQTEEEIRMQVTIDQPTVVAPLAEAQMIGKKSEEGEANESQHLIEEERRKEEALALRKAQEAEREAERIRQEEWLGLDDKTIKMIQERLEKTREYMLKKIEDKKEEYNEKLTNSKVNLKKK